MKPAFASNRPVRKSAGIQRTVAKSVGATTAIRSVKTTSWSNILEALRAHLCFSPRALHFSEVVIQDASPAFAKAFGIPGNVSVPLSTIFGKSTAREFQSFVERAMLVGQTIMKYVNLHRADGAVLSCHVVVRSIPSGCSAQSSMLRRTHCDDRYATLTVRSASAVGNANFVGVGLLGVDRVPPAIMERVIDGATGAPEAAAVNELLQLGNMEHFDYADGSELSL
jgi:hypothetical protein